MMIAERKNFPCPVCFSTSHAPCSLALQHASQLLCSSRAYTWRKQNHKVLVVAQCTSQAGVRVGAPWQGWGRVTVSTAPWGSADSSSLLPCSGARAADCRGPFPAAGQGVPLEERANVPFCSLLGFVCVCFRAVGSILAQLM